MGRLDKVINLGFARGSVKGVFGHVALGFDRQWSHFKTIDQPEGFDRSLHVSNPHAVQGLADLHVALAYLNLLFGLLDCR